MYLLSYIAVHAIRATVEVSTDKKFFLDQVTVNVFNNGENASVVLV